MIKGWIQAYNTQNVYTANDRVSKYMKKNSELKGKIDNFIIIVNNINTHFLTLYRLKDK